MKVTMRRDDMDRKLYIRIVLSDFFIADNYFIMQDFMKVFGDVTATMSQKLYALAAMVARMEQR